MKILNLIKNLWKKPEEQFVLTADCLHKSSIPTYCSDASKSIFVKQPERYRTVMVDHTPRYLYIPNILFEASISKINRRFFVFTYLSVYAENKGNLYSLPFPNILSKTVCMSNYNERRSGQNPFQLADDAIDYFWTSRFNTSYDHSLGYFLAAWSNLSQTGHFQENGFDKLKYLSSNDTLINMRKLFPYPELQKVETRTLLKKWKHLEPISW